MDQLVSKGLLLLLQCVRPVLLQSGRRFLSGQAPVLVDVKVTQHFTDGSLLQIYTIGIHPLLCHNYLSLPYAASRTTLLNSYQCKYINLLSH